MMHEKSCFSQLGLIVKTFLDNVSHIFIIMEKQGELIKKALDFSESHTTIPMDKQFRAQSARSPWS